MFDTSSAFGWLLIKPYHLWQIHCEFCFCFVSLILLISLSAFYVFLRLVRFSFRSYLFTLCDSLWASLSLSSSSSVCTIKLYAFLPNFESIFALSLLFLFFLSIFFFLLLLQLLISLFIDSRIGGGGGRCAIWFMSWLRMRWAKALTVAKCR